MSERDLKCSDCGKTFRGDARWGMLDCLTMEWRYWCEGCEIASTQLSFDNAIEYAKRVGTNR